MSREPVIAPPQATGEASLPAPEEHPHKFVPDSNWTMLTGKTSQDTEPFKDPHRGEGSGRGACGPH